MRANEKNQWSRHSSKTECAPCRSSGTHHSFWCGADERGKDRFFFSFSSFFLSFSFGSSYLVQRRRRRCLTGDGHPASSQSRARDVGRARQTGSDRGGRVTECIHPPCPSCWNHLFMGGRKESRGKSKNSRIQKMN